MEDVLRVLHRFDATGDGCACESCDRRLLPAPVEETDRAERDCRREGGAEGEAGAGRVEFRLRERRWGLPVEAVEAVLAVEETERVRVGVGGRCGVEGGCSASGRFCCCCGGAMGIALAVAVVGVGAITVPILGTAIFK